ncbi:MAG: hypothetical protein RBU30_02175 [Polyangia bacterium]|jgi:hypothetical protein|nr:hypothetical protein [Polyangia bacterium]
MSRWRKTILAATALSLSASLGARAQSTRFDFEGPRADQTGAYLPDSDAELSSGVARLRPVEAPPWHSPGWRFRLGVTLHNPESTPLSDYPVRIDLSSAPQALFDESRLDGADLLPVLVSSGGIIGARWVESLDFIGREGALWVRLGSLAPGDTELLIYFGNASWQDGGSAESFFTLAAGWVTACVVSPLAAQATLTVQSFVDGNVVSVEGGAASLSLNSRQLGTIAPADLSPGTFLRGIGPFYGTFSGGDADSLVPIGFAARTFVMPSVRDVNLFDVVAPFGDALVSIYDGDVLVTSQTVAVGAPATITADVANDAVARVESDRPVLVHHHASNTTSGADYDSHALLPPSLDLLGASTGSSRLVAQSDNTQVSVWYSDGTSESFSLDRTSVRVLLGSGTQGSGLAARVVASAPVMAVTTGDGDGGDAVSYLPTRELGRRYLLPFGGQYLQVATLWPGTRCEILDGGGQTVTAQTSNSYGANYPGVLLFTGIAAGGELRCDAPVWAMFEDPGSDTERNLWPIKLHRPRTENDATAVLLAVQPRYASTRGSVVTPTFEAPFAVAEWTAFIETSTLPEGTWLRYQLSDDGGATWLHYDGEAWSSAASLDESNPWWDVHLNLGAFPAGANGLTVKAILGSQDGSRSPELDDLAIYYRQKETATRFTFDEVPSPQRAGRPFQVTIRATDELGRTIQGFSHTASLQTLAGQTAPSQSPPFIDGAVTFDVSVAEVGQAVQLYAYAETTSGRSNSFEVTATDGASIELISGDQQFALAGTRVPEPLMVRVLDSEGEPAAAVTLSFAVTSGDGTVILGAAQGASLEAETDAAGIASVSWELGPRSGTNRVEARLPGALGSPVVFTARGDRNPDLPGGGSGGSGCSCNAPGRTSGMLLILFVLVALGLSRRRLPGG